MFSSAETFVVQTSKRLDAKCVYRLSKPGPDSCVQLSDAQAT